MLKLNPIAFAAPCALLLLSIAQSPNAVAQVYKWVDANGRTHYGDAAPNAKSGTPRSFAAIPEQARPAQSTASSAAPAAAAPSTPAAATPFQPVASQTTPPAAKAEAPCIDEWRRYYESVECFDRFRMRFGLRPEAFQHCQEVQKPLYICPDYPKRYIK